MVDYSNNFRKPRVASPWITLTQHRHSGARLPITLQMACNRQEKQCNAMRGRGLKGQSIINP